MLFSLLKWKMNVWRPELRRKLKNLFIKQCGAKWSNFFLVTTKKCANESFSSLSESKLKNKCLEYEKSEETNVWNLVLGKRTVKKIPKKCVFVPGGVIFYYLQPKHAQKNVFQVSRSQIWKTSLWSKKNKK